VVAAFLVEYPFYLVTGFPTVRERLSGPYLPLVLTGSMVLPYLLCCCGAVPFQWSALISVGALPLAVSLWYRVLLPSKLSDIGFLLLLGTVMLGNYFAGIYPRFYGQHLEALGNIGLVHVMALALMLERRIPETGWGFWPNVREWRIGLLHYVGFVAVGVPLAFALHAVRIGTRPVSVWIILGTFFGCLWVSSLAEEFLFRGVMQQWFESWSRSRMIGLLVTSALFGLVHLWFRGFPNWRWVPLAAVLGLFCGNARNQAGSIRSSAATHALVVTSLRAFLS
jgi:membrane protease YdiL (CAAX protease family)